MLNAAIWPTLDYSRVPYRLYRDPEAYQREQERIFRGPRALHHPVPDRRYRKDADFASILRYLLPPGWEWLVGAPRQFVPQLLEQSLHALRLNGLEGHPVYSRSPIILFGHLIRCA